jgi:hypothetical protein
MTNGIIQWLKSHSSAVLGTALAASQLGLLGKAGIAIVGVLAALCGKTLSN